MNVFKLVVYAIIALILINFILGLRPLFEKREDPNKILLDMLEYSQFETKLGKMTNKYIEIDSGTTLRGEHFDTKQRSVAFRCNSKLMCCEKKQECGKIKWDERRIFFPNRTKILVSTRCEYAYGLYACSVYFGQKPAQLILEAQKNFEADLKKESNKVPIKIKNIGSTKALNINVTWKLYTLGEESSKYLEMEDSTIIASLDSDAQKQIFIELPATFLKNEKMQLVVTAKANEAGFDKKEIILNVKNLETTKCRRTYAEGKKRLIEGMCVERLYCEGCKYAVECEKVWEEKFLTNAESIHAATPQYAYREYHPTEQCEEYEEDYES